MNQYNNGSHRSEEQGYFEWWYFHFVQTNGDVFNIVLHETDIFGHARLPYISMSILPRGGKPKYFRTEVKTGIHVGSSYLEVGNLIQETKEAIRISVVFSESTSLELIIHKALPPLALNDGVLYQTNPEHQSHWLVEVARAEYQGTLTLEGQTQEIKGIAYHDHQWGNVPIQDFVQDWIWGHFSDEIQTHIFFYIASQDGQVIRRYIHTENDRIATSLAVESPHLWLLSQDVAPQSVQSETFVKAGSGLPLLTFQVDPEHLFRSRVDEDQGTFRSTYLRWKSEARYNNALLSGITEYMRIRK